MNETISGRPSRFIHAVPQIATHCFIVQANSGTFRRLYADQAALIIVRSGMKRLLSARVSIEARPGEAIVLPMGQDWTVINETGVDGAYRAEALIFSPDLIAAYASPMLPAVREALRFRPDGDFEDAFERAGRSLENGGPPDALRRHLLGEIIIRLDAFGIGLLPIRRDTLYERVRTLVANDPAGEWSTRKIAMELGVSEATLRRKLASSGTTLTEVIVDVRMTCAVGLLQATEAPINQVALDVGYVSASKFAARFRERFGLSPRDIRIPAAANERHGLEIDRIRAAAE